MKIIEALNLATQILKDCKIDSAVIDARLLLQFITSYSQENLILKYNEDLQREHDFFLLIDRRKHHEPIAYIIGCKEFYSRNFIIDKNVLIPRPETEFLVDTVLSDYKADSKIKILELGTGSGCIISTLLLEMPNASAVASDISSKALDIAKQNILQYQLENRINLIESNWFESLGAKKFDIIISNPPYISKEEIGLMSKETFLYEPEIALFSNNRGLESYENIAKNSISYLNKDGKIFVEIGLNPKRIIDIFSKYNWHLEKIIYDFSNQPRILVFYS